MEIISEQELAAYLRVDLDPGMGLVIQLTNGIVTEAWANPTGLLVAPKWVEAIAYEVAARAWRNPDGLSSWTLSFDDGSRTQRLPDQAARAGVFLTDVERDQLAGIETQQGLGFWSGSLPMGPGRC